MLSTVNTINADIIDGTKRTKVTVIHFRESKTINHGTSESNRDKTSLKTKLSRSY